MWIYGAKVVHTKEFTQVNAKYNSLEINKCYTPTRWKGKWMFVHGLIQLKQSTD